MKRILCCMLLIVLTVPLLTSCMGLRQINELAMVAAVGLDLGEKPGTVRLSAQIIRPADARGQTGAPSGGTGEPIYSISTEGSSIFDAIRNMGQISSRRVYWAHNFLIVMSEQYARKGIDDMVDFFTRNHELRMNTWVAVTSDKPDEVISTVTGLEVVPGEAVDRLFRDHRIAGRAPGTNMMSLEESYLSDSTEPVIARVSLQPRGVSNKKPGEHGSIKQVELKGAAAFKHGQMVGWLTADDARGVLFFLERLDKGIEVISCPDSDTNMITLEFNGAKLKVMPAYAQGRPKFDVHLTAKADIVENGCSQSTSQLRKDADEGLDQELTQTLEGVIDKAQHKYRTDFLKMGDVFRNKYPAEWKKLKKDWDEAFAEAEITVQVETTVKSGVVKATREGIK
ncbi:Ger(x)C family spore germination protein [Paenibacillus sp. PR3]|uniref:Ger(X)C family spore germination protein n=1 Tax=Paenibacillus terricola TaxID=2763503 RepID=A0ABR8N0Q5_9BACL|nr:Ger(x)C family spore germination protein [Paenibacillus terricola]MBD3920917.1 Ger(x)C family spore germination protein [Paenibacillus terricola]